jgi:SAM-dependent methyltransferase
MPAAPDNSKAIFEEQWLTYRKVIDSDYMEHAAIHHALATCLRNHPRRSHSLGDVLDLGCGDAEISSSLANEFSCLSYLGVDTSSMALSHAKANPCWGTIKPRFREADLTTFVIEEQSRFDLILAGFVLHHLQSPAKQAFFESIKNLLRPGGLFLFYDVFCRPGLSRDASVAEYLQWIARDWKEITEPEHQAIAAHIDSSDFPEDVDWIIAAARKGGFNQAETLVTCANGFHHAIAFSC